MGSQLKLLWLPRMGASWLGYRPQLELFPPTKMLIKACFLIQLEQEGGYQKCCISLCSKVFINHFYQMKASPEGLNILIYWSKYWVERLRRTIRRKVSIGIFHQQIYRLCYYILHQVAHISCSAPSGKLHEPLTGVWGMGWGHVLPRKTCRQPSFPRWRCPQGVMFLTFLWPQSGRATPSWAVINTISPLF